MKLIRPVDEKNMNHLFSDTFNILDFLRRYSEENFLASPLKPGYPTESVGRSLIMWIAWLLYTYGMSSPMRVERWEVGRYSSCMESGG